MIAALTGSELDLIVLIIGVLVLLGAAYVAWANRPIPAVVIAVIGVLLILLAS